MMKTTISRMPTKGPANDFTMNLSSFFIPIPVCVSVPGRLCGTEFDHLGESVLQALGVLTSCSCETRLSATASENALCRLPDILACILSLLDEVRRIHQDKSRLLLELDCSGEHEVLHLLLEDGCGILHHCRVHRGGD